ncbi:hatching enzyme 1.2 isoform X1 [Hippoglossus stenolepis]|uniref:hatching enzyme 1.2 isoform X1 n=1 Tax=Hippoglossus stenolepis TaxID=195615 RepID=UPI00159C1CB8|nr:hatching enzyme 1.2 isoform X1 [Hippoglossus stenolepis]
MTPVFLLLLLFFTAQYAADEANELDESPAVSDVLEKVNDGLRNLVFGDIAQNVQRNADPCTSTGCAWPKRGSYVRVPVAISSRYTTTERNIIIRSLVSFHKYTCIRFVWRRWYHRHYLYFYSGSGCWSYVGRQSRGQAVSLKKNGCLYKGTVQHEVLHALGFHHEQVRSDRDKYIQILTNNIIPGKEHNFDKENTNNLATPYDFNSVMHYSKYAFSKNRKPTILARSDPNLDFGRAKSMSSNDVARINKLYRCSV